MQGGGSPNLAHPQLLCLFPILISGLHGLVPPFLLLVLRPVSEQTHPASPLPLLSACGSSPYWFMFGVGHHTSILVAHFLDHFPQQDLLSFAFTCGLPLSNLFYPIYNDGACVIDRKRSGFIPPI